VDIVLRICRGNPWLAAPGSLFTVGYPDAYYNNHPDRMVHIGATAAHGGADYNRYMTTLAAHGIYNTVGASLTLYSLQGQQVGAYDQALLRPQREFRHFGGRKHLQTTGVRTNVVRLVQAGCPDWTILERRKAGSPGPTHCGLARTPFLRDTLTGA
jgi:hypothetical protein